MAFKWGMARFFEGRFAFEATFPKLASDPFKCLKSKIDADREFVEQGVYPKVSFSLEFLASDFVQCGRPANQSILIFNGQNYRVANDPVNAEDSTGETFLVTLELENQ